MAVFPEKKRLFVQCGSFQCDIKLQFPKAKKKSDKKLPAWREILPKCEIHSNHLSFAGGKFYPHTEGLAREFGCTVAPVPEAPANAITFDKNRFKAGVHIEEPAIRWNGAGLVAMLGGVLTSDILQFIRTAGGNIWQLWQEAGGAYVLSGSHCTGVFSRIHSRR
jgi:hypothetical protein